MNERKKANTIYYRNNNIIKKGIIIVSIASKEKYHKLEKSSKLSMRIVIFDNKIKILRSIEIFNTNIKYFKNIGISEVHYNLINDMLLLFIDKKIYQIYLKRKEVISIYDISQYNETLTRIYYNYDEKNKNIEQLILLINKKDGKIYLFNWNEKMIIFKKEYK